MVGRTIICSVRGREWQSVIGLDVTEDRAAELVESEERTP